MFGGLLARDEISKILIGGCSWKMHVGFQGDSGETLLGFSAVGKMKGYDLHVLASLLRIRVWFDGVMGLVIFGFCGQWCLNVGVGFCLGCNI